MKAVGLAGVVLVLCSLLPALARAQEKQGFELGVRTGFMTPLGSAAAGSAKAMNATIAGEIPIWIDLGGRVSPAVFVGGYASYGLIGIAGGSCYGDCSHHVLRVGAEMHYHFAPTAKMDPWLGAGVGYEGLQFNQSYAGGTVDGTAHGVEFLNAQFGLDFALSPKLALGPFLGATISQYNTDFGGGDLAQKAIHSWFSLGVRLSVVP